ncbi:MAG: hypothetical protein ACRDMV_16085 [Streptosporangiales bacterium]
MPQTQGADVHPELVESLFREIRDLRETVAALRSAGSTSAPPAPVRVVPQPVMVVASGCGDRHDQDGRKAS